MKSGQTSRADPVQRKDLQRGQPMLYFTNLQNHKVATSVAGDPDVAVHH
jgi:hypothetical protein